MSHGWLGILDSIGWWLWRCSSGGTRTFLFTVGWSSYCPRLWPSLTTFLWSAAAWQDYALWQIVSPCHHSHSFFDNCCLTRSFVVSSLMLVVTTVSSVFMVHLMITLLVISPRSDTLLCPGGIFTVVLLKSDISGLCTDFSESRWFSRVDPQSLHFPLDAWLTNLFQFDATSSIFLSMLGWWSVLVVYLYWSSEAGLLLGPGWSLLLHAVLWVCLDRRMPLSSHLICCLLFSWMRPLLQSFP